MYKTKIIQLTILILIISIYSLSFKYAPDVNKLYTAAVSNINIKILRDWANIGGFSRTLKIGSSGTDIRLIQEALATDKNIYPEALNTGFFGNATRNAIIRFQKEYNLTPTGFFNSNTKEYLNKIFLYELCPQKSYNSDNVNLLTKVNKTTPLPKGYIPPNLQKLPSDIPKTSPIICLRSDVIPHLIEMFREAKLSGAHLVVTSGFRSIQNQTFLYKYWSNHIGIKAKKLSAIPGHSEHQLGTTVDLTTSSMKYIGLSLSFANTKEGLWLQNNAYKYGFTLSYPPDKEYITGYEYEPWHWRYVGKDIATKLKKERKVLSEIQFQTTPSTTYAEKSQKQRQTNNQTLKIEIK